jgi:hypothetical protein
MTNAELPPKSLLGGGAKVACICGKILAECSRHAAHQLNGRYHYPDGFYVPMDDVSGDYWGNGVVGTYYSPDQDFIKMETIALRMQDGTEDEEEEFERLT